jgi:hypothetical protein
MEDRVLTPAIEQAIRREVEARAALRLTEEQRVLLEGQVERMGPLYFAARVACAVYEAAPDWEHAQVQRALSEMLDAHRATTPSPEKPTHVVVAVEELERLRGQRDDALSAAEMVGEQLIAAERELQRLRPITKRLDEAIEFAFPDGSLDQVSLIDIRDGDS